MVDANMLYSSRPVVASPMEKRTEPSSKMVRTLAASNLGTGPSVQSSGNSVMALRSSRDRNTALIFALSVLILSHTNNFRASFIHSYRTDDGGLRPPHPPDDVS